MRDRQVGQVLGRFFLGGRVFGRPRVLKQPLQARHDRSTVQNREVRRIGRVLGLLNQMRVQVVLDAALEHVALAAPDLWVHRHIPMIDSKNMHRCLTVDEHLDKRTTTVSKSEQQLY